MQEVDARGLSCPEPALMTMEAIEAFPGEKIRVLVSAATQKQNVTELAQQKGKQVSASQVGNDFELIIS